MELPFYDLMFNRFKPAEAIEKYVGESYIRHNPDVGDGKDAFVEYFNRMAKDYPGKSVEFKKDLAEDSCDACYRHCPAIKIMQALIFLDLTTGEK